MSQNLALLWTERLISVAVLLQTIEYWLIRSSYRDGGIWDWHLLRTELMSWPRPLRGLADLVLSYKGFCCVLALRFGTAAWMLVEPSTLPAAWMFLSTWLILIRFRGPFNGGSDSMTLLSLLTVSIACLMEDSPKAQIACLGYLAIQSCLSYFIAGIIKVKKSNWRSGKALRNLFRSSIYAIPERARGLADRPGLCRVGAWIMLVFECGFPLALVFPSLCIPFLAAGMVFHLANAALLGLNRFWLAWLATYPAIYYWSTSR